MDPIFEPSLELSASLHAQMLVGSLPTQGAALASADTVLSQTKLIPTLELGDGSYTVTGDGGTPM